MTKEINNLSDPPGEKHLYEMRVKLYRVCSFLSLLRKLVPPFRWIKAHDPSYVSINYPYI